MELDTILKSVQSLFYVFAGAVAVLTYLSAKNILLNTVNTEYHKKVIESLYRLSEELYSEFNRESPDWWPMKRTTEEFVKQINEQARLHKHEILTSERRPIGIPVTELEEKLLCLVSKYKSDPFLPDKVMTDVLALLEGRFLAVNEVYREAAQHYLEQLAKGKYWDSLDKNCGWIHNRINGKLYDPGYSISQVEYKMHGIRIGIKQYFSRFDPLIKV
jgi:hypothetical protein